MNTPLLARVIGCLALLCAASFHAAAADALESAFVNPPKDARPWTFWYWMHNSVTKEAITRDLEAMADHGIGGVYLFSIGGGKALTDPPVPSLTDIWWEHIDHTFREADRLGLKVRLNACDGWATAGSPDITPELSMQEITATNIIVEGGATFDGQLPQPPAKLDHYRDIAVLAYPEPVSNARTSVELKPKVTASQPGLNATPLIAGSAKGLELPNPGWVQYEFSAPFTCRAVTVQPLKKSYQSMRLEVQVSDDGQNFRSLGRLSVPRHGFSDSANPMTTAFPATQARYFRFVCDSAGSELGSEDLDAAKERTRNASLVSQIILSESPTLTDWQGKAGRYWRASPETTAALLPDQAAVPLAAITNLTAQMSPDGRLRWTAPAGSRWIVQRLGHTSTAKKNGPAGAGIGLEPDKFNPAAVATQFRSWSAKAAARQAGLGTHSLVGSHVDSWECNSQNWSPVMLAEFKRRRGYDPVPYLPVMAGVPVQSAEISERFLGDIRQTISELLLDNFFTPMVDLVHGKGGDFSAECVAPIMMCDGMAHFGRVDLPMGEFWYESVSGDKPNDILDAIHGARLYGKPIVQAEAFTHRDIDWDDSPFEMKTLGDHHFALGINRFILHVWALKATPGKPGVNLWNYGAEYSNGQTWWQPGRAWFEYLARCQAVLQRGTPVADVLYYVGENQPTRALPRARLKPALPDGYTYGSINREALLKIAQPENGALLLPGGLRYRLLVLPPDDRMSPEVARAVAALSQAGVPVVGPKPTRSPSLTDFPRCDAALQKIVAEGWDKIRPAENLRTVLNELKCAPDLLFSDANQTPVWRPGKQYSSPSISWGHRRDGDADIYFISNQEYAPRALEASFKVQGKQPELWDPATGKLRPLYSWSIREGRTRLALQFAPAESFFIVFRSTASPSAHPEPNFPAFRSLQTIEGPWELSFEPNRGTPPTATLPALASLHTHADPAIQHFSGTVTYRHAFAPKKTNRPLYLDLGQVANLAEVKLNGQSLGVLWKPPYRIALPASLLAPENQLEIAVSTTWHNRMVADAALPPEQRIAQAPLYRWNLIQNKPLVPAGLLGPVTLAIETP